MKTAPSSNASHKDRIFKEAELEFSKSVHSQKEIPLEIFKNFRKNQEQRLQRWHASGGSGKDNAQRRSDLVDVLFKNLFNLVINQAPKGAGKKLCVVAFGGYGRGEMSPHSDVDVMFLYEEKKLTSNVEKLISSILMALWDLGFKVGHATRSIHEAIEHANKEMLSKTAMLECRLLAGDQNTFKNFKEKFRKKCILGREEEYITWRLENIQRLREKFGKTVFMQEPNIKSGAGGLRDYQNLLWISIVQNDAATYSYLVKQKFLRESERKKLENDYDFLLRVRNEMHYQEKRANDQLTIRLQGKVATALGYSQRSIIRRSEAFMKDYYEKTREIHLITSSVLQRMRPTTKRPRFLSVLFPIKKRVDRFDGFIIREEYLFPEDKEIFKDSSRLMRAFHLAQIRSLKFSPELRDLVKRHLSSVDRTFQQASEIRRIFLSILSRKGEVGRILRLMHDLGFLGKYLPEFGALTCLVQHEFYHLYTADEHTLVCIEKIDALLVTSDKKLSRYNTLFKNLDDPAMLYLGMLLHDTGKAANVRHHAEASAVAAQKVITRLQIQEERAALLKTLVDAHGELATVARTRDLDDFTTISHFANVVKKVSTLDALMILTLADGMGTSDSHWSDWKEQLVWNLYDQTKRYLELGALFFEKKQTDRAFIKTAVKKIVSDDFKEEIEAHFEQMPERYFRTMEPSLIAQHLQLFRNFFEALSSNHHRCLDAKIRWSEHPEAGHTEVWICGWDRKQLLERIAAAFLAAEINILSADIFTRRDHLTLDIFRVTSVRSDPLLNEKEKKSVEQRLRELLVQSGNEKLVPPISTSAIKLTQNDTIIPARVSIDNQSHPSYTLVEIETPDRCGLFYDLLGALNCHGISIDLARIATEMRAAFDTFYILGADKKKLTNEAVIKELQERLVAAVAPLVATPGSNLHVQA